MFDNFEYRIRNRKLKGNILDVGINDAPFVVQPTINGVKVVHPAYICWYNMLTRCFSDTYKERFPSYKNVTCCDDWLLFTKFALWFKANYQLNYVLDKDLIVKDNKIYSPTTCLFVPESINQFLTIRSSERGEQPLGVQLHKSKFIARIGAERVNLGSFTTSKEAHLAWQTAKLEQAIAFNFPPLQRVIKQLQFEIDNDLETTSL